MMIYEATPFDDVLAPLTSALGFLRAPFDDVVKGLCEWRSQIHGSAHVSIVEEGLRDSASRLEPLTGGVVPRELVVQTQNPEWTALIDCGVDGSDPETTVGYLSRAMQVQGLAVISIPDHGGGAEVPERFGARQFELFGPVSTDFLNYVRVISLVRDRDRWRFDTSGTVQDFEDVNVYRKRRVAERFTAGMLVKYCAALGLRPFDSDFYPGPAALVENPSTPPEGALVLSLAEARRRSGITGPDGRPFTT